MCGLEKFSGLTSLTIRVVVAMARLFHLVAVHDDLRVRRDVILRHGVGDGGEVDLAAIVEIAERDARGRIRRDAPLGKHAVPGVDRLVIENALPRPWPAKGDQELVVTI